MSEDVVRTVTREVAEAGPAGLGQADLEVTA